MDLWQLIAADHARLKELCREILEAAQGGAPGRDLLFEWFDRELERHMRAEERVLNPALERDERSRPDALMVAREHGEIRARLDGLAADANEDDANEDPVAWVQSFEGLANILERHFGLEEYGLLVTARGVLEPRQADKLKQAFEQAKTDAFRTSGWEAPGSRTLLTALMAAVALAGTAALALTAARWRWGSHAQPAPPVRGAPRFLPQSSGSQP